MVCASIYVFARFSGEKDAFKQAEDFPREALIYVQIRDLPALIKRWQNSELREKYYQSANYEEFENRHLALKLAERGGEIYEQIGVLPNLGFASTLSETSAALAVYDIGKLEFVFVAPMSEEKILASALNLVKSNFDEIRLDEETIVYAKEIEVDRARQRQKVLFTSFKGRLILATSEKYFLQTLDNIKNKASKNRLSNEPDFRRLAEKTKPNLATVWLDQAKLNDDWYFKHYWLMSEVESLKNLRAGLFDFEIDENKLIENRVFLTKNERVDEKINPATAAVLSKFVPANTPLTKLETANTFDLSKSLKEILFESIDTNQTREPARARNDFYFRDWEKSYSYSYLDSDFSEQVDEIEDESTPIIEPLKINDNLEKTISAASPTAALKIFSPKSAKPPLFFENRKAQIFLLRSPQNLDKQSIENAIAEKARELLTVGDQPNEFFWQDFSFGETKARAMAMPSLGWKIFYAQRQNALIFADSEDLLEEILSAQNETRVFSDSFENLTVIHFARREEVFDEIFTMLAASERTSGNDAAQKDFFTGNIASLLDVASDLEKIEIKRNSAPNLLFEETVFTFKKNPR